MHHFYVKIFLTAVVMSTLVVPHHTFASRLCVGPTEDLLPREGQFRRRQRGHTLSLPMATCATVHLGKSFSEREESTLYLLDSATLGAFLGASANGFLFVGSEYLGTATLSGALVSQPYLWPLAVPVLAGAVSGMVCYSTAEPSIPDGPLSEQ